MLSAKPVHLAWRDVCLGPGLPVISTSVSEAETAMLKSLAEGKDVLEVGSAFGYSACVMALAGARYVVAVDPLDILGFDVALPANLAACGVSERVEIIQERSETALPRLAAQEYKFDFMFIDGAHEFANVFHDAEWAKKLVKPGGMLAMHDYLERCCCPEVGPAAHQAFPGACETVDSMLLVRM